jgi:type I restriction enzyme S subunit
MTTTLSDYCDLISIQVDPCNNNDAVYLGLEHIRSGELLPMGGGLGKDVQSSKFAFKKNDVLYGKLRPYLDKSVLADCDGICTTELLVLRPKPEVDPRFLACTVHTHNFIEHAMSGVTGAQHPRTSWHRISKFEILPFSPNEQRAIADLVWKIHDALRTNGSALVTFQEVKQATMRVLFSRGLRGEKQKETEIGMIPESWNLETVGNHFAVASGGTPSRAVETYWSDGTIPWVKTTEVNYRKITNTEERITRAGLEHSAAKLLPIGTVLMAMYGQGVTRGRVAVLGIEAACNQACAAMTPLKEEVSPRFLYHFLAFRYEEIRRMAHGGQQQNLNLDIVRSLPLPVTAPKDPEEQKEIVLILDALDEKIDLHERKKSVLEKLFQTLLQKLIAGDVRVSDLDLSPLETAPSIEVTV